MKMMVGPTKALEAGNGNSQMPSHLMRLPKGEWGLWRWVGLRAAGFPCSLVLKLGFPEFGATADELLRVEAEAERAQQNALEAVRDEMKSVDEQRHDVLRKAQRRINKWNLPGEIPFEYGSSREVAVYELALGQLNLARASYKQAFQSAIGRSLEAIRQFAQSRQFREALIWQNHTALHTALDPLLRRPAAIDSRSSKYRQHEELIASYVQRYCVKNDTIGFFGPISWAKLVPHGDALNVKPGPELLASRKVYFEAWTIESLADKLDENKAYLPWATPRRMPDFYLDGTVVYQRSDPSYNISEKQLALIQECDGERTAKQIAREMLAASPPGFESEEDVYATLAQLAEKELVAWKFEIPFQPFPERALQRLIARIEDESLRNPAIEALNELEAGRDAVARAAGDPEKLDEALINMNSTFNRLTGVASARAGGRMYAGRTLLYEDCVRSLEVEIGPELLESLAPALSLVLASTRWLTHEIACEQRKMFAEVYADLVEETGSSTVSAISFWERVGPQVYSENPVIINGVVKALQDRWAEILNIPPGRRHVTYTAEELRQSVMTAFHAPRPGWAMARYSCPDLMIAARSAEAIRRGDYQFVLGEVHLASNTLGYTFFLDNHPAPHELLEGAQSDMPEPRLVPATPKRWNGLVARTIYALESPRDFTLEISPDSFGGPKSQTLRISELVLEKQDGNLIVRTRDGRQQFDVLESVTNFLMQTVIEAFRILPRASYRPRITIDRLVICRESWARPVSELDFAHIKDEAELFIAVRRWARSKNIPRFAFMRVPIEIKPVFIDFDSPVYVNIFARLARRTRESSPESEIVLTEMLPDLNHAWLQDVEGQSYTSEFRIVAVDLAK